MDVKVFQILHEQYEKLKTDIKADKTGNEGECSWDSNPAKALMEEMTGKILELIRTNGKNGRHYYRLIAMEGAVHYQHAKVLVRLNMAGKAREILKYAVESLKEYFLVPEVTFLGLRVLNHYCYLLTKSGDLEKSQELLEFAEARYKEMKSKDGKFYSNDDLFDAAPELKSSKEINEKLERVVTNNLQMLGFVYSKQGKMDKFAVYHHEVLRRQLDMREGDATVWAMKTARLGYFFITRNKFAQARHHLAAACYVLSQYENTLKTLETSDLVLAKWEELNHRYADIAKCWVKYGLFLFSASRLKLVSTYYGDSSPLFDGLWANPLDRFNYGSNGRSEQDDIDLQSVWTCEADRNAAEGLKPSEGTTDLKNTVDGEQPKTESASKSNASLNPPPDIFDVIFRNSNPSNVSIGILPTEIGQGFLHFANEAEGDKNGIQESQEEKDFIFPNLNLSCFENCVTCSYVDNLQAARGLFLFTHSWLKKSKLFYTLKDHPMEYVNVILDLSELYRYFAFYEDDIENQYSLQKRRAETLETLSTVLKDLRPQCYIAVSVELLRELAEIHLELMSLNLRRLCMTNMSMPKTESKSSPQYFTDLSEEAMRKVKAVADIHLRLNKFTRMEKELREKYHNVTTLLEEESLKDPKEEPYRSKYKAKNILLEMENVITSSDTLDSSHPDHIKYQAMLATIFMQVGVISIETEEPSTGEEYLMKAFEKIPDHLDRMFVINSINIRNHLGILWSQRSESSKAQSWLEGAEKLYEDFKKKSPLENPLTHQELFETDEIEEKSQGAGEIERVHTLTKFYLAQVYGCLRDLLRSAIYCHETLRRQLVCGEYDSIDWALNSATLSQFFMERILFTQARHHLAAASYILDKYENSLSDVAGTEEEIECKKEELRHRSADVSRCWAKYGIFLLEYSMNKLSAPQPENEKITEHGTLKELWFTSLDLSKYENEVLASELILYEDARQTFLFAQRHLNKAKEYYSLECHASDHVQVVQDHSQLFKHLTAFENEEDKQCKMIKKRIDLLQGVLKELNPKYYLHACRQLWFELGECYHDLMDIKFQRVKASKEVPTPHALKKINFLIEHSITNFTHFLNSVRDNSTKELPEVLDEEMIKPTLIAHFYLGRLYYKIITQDTNKQIENMNRSNSCFKYLVDYCDKSEYAREILSEELNVSKEMISLLQLKALQI